MKPLKVYACYNTDRDIRLSSSSGAVFSSVAEYVLQQKGTIYGVAMSEDCYSAEFISVTSKEGLVKLRGSKYVQAKIGNTYNLVKNDLLSGKLVLFTGTGCQVNGLKYFLGRNYDNLICVDFICHGVPSPALWREYAKYQEKKNNGKLRAINFRCKDKSWLDFGMKEIIDTESNRQFRKMYISKDQDSYMQMFLKDYCLRPSCYECVAKKLKMSDITIADFWGINDIYPHMNDGMGTSLVLVRSDKGKEIFDIICENMKLQEVSYEEGVKSNQSEYKSRVRPIQRDTFFKDMQSMNFENLEKKYVTSTQMSFLIRVKRKFKKTFRGLQYIIGGGQRVSAAKNMDYSLCLMFNCQENS